MTLANDVALIRASMPKTAAKLGVFVDRVGNLVRVNTGGTTVTLPFVGLSLPPAGHSVQMQQTNGQMVVTGPARPLPGKGILTATGSPRATVTAWEVEYSLPYMGSYTPVLNDEVAITWTTDGGLITGSLSAPPKPIVVEAPQPAPDPGPQQYHPAPFTAVDAGSFQAGRWTKADVWASDSLTGFWFYGPAIKDTIPDGAVINSAAIYLSPTRQQFAAPNLQAHNASTRPPGEPAFVGGQHQPGGRSGWQPIPVAFVDFLKGNDGGIGVNHGGYNVFRSLAQDSLSGALDISYTA